METTTSQWWYELNGEQKGPVNEEEIQKLINYGSLKKENFVWKEGLAAWIPIHNSALIAHFRQDVPPPMTGEAVNNTIVWWLAFAPLLGMVAKEILFGVTPYMQDYHQYWFVTTIINIALSFSDDKNLKKAGYDTSKLGAAWLVPVYLYRRAEMLKQNNAYFWIWTILFVLSLSGETNLF